METSVESPSTRQELIEQQKAKLQRVLSQIEPGLAIEIISYGPNTVRSVATATYTGGNRSFYNSLITGFFNEACAQLKEGQRLRIQVVTGMVNSRNMSRS